MAPVFIFPANIQELEDDGSDDRLRVLNLVSFASMRPSEIEEFAKGVSFDLSEMEIVCVEDQDVFDRVYSLIKEFSILKHGCKFNIVESLRSNLSVLLPSIESLSRTMQSDNDTEHPALDRISSYRNAFKIYSFFLMNIVLSEESNATTNNISKVTGGPKRKNHLGASNWETQRARILTVIANSLEINLSLLFSSSVLDLSYLSFITRNVFSMFENAALLKCSETKDALCRIIGTCAMKYQYISQSCASILHLIHKHDFSVPHLADAVARAEKKYADGSLATSIIREIGRGNPKDYARDGTGADNVGHFLIKISEHLPKLVSSCIGVLVPHFSGESYKIRNALVGVLGKLVANAFKDDEGEVSAKCARLRTKQAMLEILMDRCRDVSAYTRSRVLQVWADLCEDHSLSIGLWNEVSELGIGRLEDKSAIVRKSALGLLVMMLQHNPFGPQLQTASFRETLEQYKKKLSDHEEFSGSGSLLEEGSSVEGDGDLLHTKEGEENANPEGSIRHSFLSQSYSGNESRDDIVPDMGNLEQTRALVASLEAGLRFAKCVSASMPILVQLMASTSVTDVENSIVFLMRCKQFQIDNSEACLRKMLPLVFSQDKTIQEAVENAFVTIYVTENPVETAKNLLNLAVESNIGDLAALESIIGVLVSKGDISSSTITALWDFFCFNIGGTTAEQCRGALSILSMAAKLSPVVLSSHIQEIVDIGFGRWSKKEPLLAREACVALQRLCDEEKSKLLSISGRKILDIVGGVVIDFNIPESIWYAAANQAISAIYKLHSSPDIFCVGLVKSSLNSVFDNGGGNSDVDNGDGGFTTVQISRLSRFLFVISHVAMNQLVYIECCVKKIRKQKTRKEKEDVENSEVDQNGEVPSNSVKNDINEELGVGASYDLMMDTMSEKAEKEIVSGNNHDKNLIGQCAHFLSKLCWNFNLALMHPDLQASAMLALCQLMIIDADYCNLNLQLLFTVAERSPSETVRSNCVIALGDLAVRFPNLLEPWTENMYARLRDEAVCVRKNAVLVLSHLILNDMMKVKGYINEMAARIEDEDERISNLAKLFFHELSKKGSNPIYNLLPDMLSKLSTMHMKEESFFNIMEFLISSIKKEKQMESLVEKLCNRFSGQIEVKQWECLAYCLSQLTFTEKGMRKLTESFKMYEHVLSRDSVVYHFRVIISKAKKFPKPEMKSCIEEFETKLNNTHLEAKEQEVIAEKAQAQQQRAETESNEGVSRAVTDDTGSSSSTVCNGDEDATNNSAQELSKDDENDSKPNLTDRENGPTLSGMTEAEPIIKTEVCSRSKGPKTKNRQKCVSSARRTRSGRNM